MLLPYKALRQLLRISYVSIFVAPPQLLDGCATFIGNIVFVLCEDQLLYPYRKHWEKKSPRVGGFFCSSRKSLLKIVNYLQG